jgi:uncharacterized membrane protein YeaQ/YmgE (transglycosylase-associated protein family)
VYSAWCGIKFAYSVAVVKKIKIFHILKTFKKNTEEKRMSLYDIIAWIVVGFLAGYLAKLIMPGPDGGGFILTTILGIVGAIVGGFVGGKIFNSGAANETFSLMGFIFAVIGAIIVLAIYRLATGRSVRG